MRTSHDRRDEYRRRRARQIVLACALIPLIVLVLWLQDHPDDSLLGLSSGALWTVAIVGAVGALLYTLRNWRCPACDGYLGRRIDPASCPHCGTQLGGDDRRR